MSLCPSEQQLATSRLGELDFGWTFLVLVNSRRTFYLDAMLLVGLFFVVVLFGDARWLLQCNQGGYWCNTACETLTLVITTRAAS